MMYADDDVVKHFDAQFSCHPAGDFQRLVVSPCAFPFRMKGDGDDVVGGAELRYVFPQQGSQGEGERPLGIVFYVVQQILV